MVKEAQNKSVEAATEVLGKQVKQTNKIIKHNQKNDKPWFILEIKDLIKERNIAYINNYLNNRPEEKRTRHEEIRNRVNSVITTHKREH